MKLRKLLMPLFVILSMLVVVGCVDETPPSSSTSSTQIQADVEEVVFEMEDTVLEPGTYTLSAHCLPENSSQLVKFTLITSIEGVTLSGNELLVSVSAEDKATFTVRASSIYDPTKSATLVFTINNPSISIEISTEEELFAIGTSPDGLTKKYVLKNNIELTKPWDPLGTADVEEDNGEIIPGEYFVGVFDGNGYTISNVIIDGDFNEGFFEQIGTTGIVKNLTLQGSVNARGWSGAIAGINGGLIENCVANVDVTVAGGSAGGLVSVNRGTLRYSYATGNVVAGVSNDSPRSTGLVAANEGTMTECYGDKDTMTTPNYIAFTPVVDNTKMLPTSLMKTAATFASWDKDVWFIEDGYYPLLKHEGFTPPAKVISVSINNAETEINVEEDETLTIEASIINGEPSDTLVYSLVSPVSGVTLNENVITFNKEEVVHLSTFTVKVTLSSNEEINATKTFTIIYNPVPVEDIIYISTEQDLINLATQTDPVALSKTYKLTNDIELAGWYNKPIGNADNPFTGTFDGQGYTISGIKGGNEGAHNFGFFGAISETATVKNVALIGAGKDADLYVGAGSGVVASVNNGLIENVIVNVNILSTTQWVAGCVGDNFGTIRNVIVLGVVAKTDNLNVPAPAVAINNEGTIENVFVDKTTSKTVSFFNEANETYDAFLLETTLMKSAATYSEFDTNVWNIVEGEYPTLKTSQPIEDIIYLSTEEDIINLTLEDADLSKHYKLANDIELAGWYNKPIGSETKPFTGIFDGQGFTISGIKGGNEGAHNFGFFGHIGETGVVKNVAFVGAGKEVDLYIGAASGVVASANYGTIENVIINVNILSTGQWVGGCVGNNYGTIKYVIVLGTVSETDDVNAPGPAFAIANEGTIENCFVDKTTSKTLTFFHVEDEVYDAYLLETPLMKSAATFSEFDTNIWNIVEGEYPTFK